MKTIIDTHAHLDQVPNVEDVLADCAAAGVSDVVALGVDFASNQKHMELSGLVSPKIHVGLGLHPGNITPEEVSACFPFFREHVKAAKVIGETGLDFQYKWVRKDDDKKREQRDVFDKHLALAVEFDLPIVIHSRGAWRECLEMTLRAGIKRAEFHWYSGPNDVLKDLLNAGYFISCTPALSSSPELHAAMRYAPLERIMVETDTPVSYGQMVDGKIVDRVPSTPKDVWKVLELLSALKGQDEDEVLAVVNKNAREFFGIA